MVFDRGRWMVLVCFILGQGNFGQTVSADQIQSTEARNKLLQLTAMREALAQTLDPKKAKITKDDFLRVCAPVGKELQRWALENGFEAKQISEKYRNPNHKPSSQDVPIIELFKQQNLQFMQLETVELNIYYQRIEVVQSCLACHGAKESRPQFIKDGYPQDKAHGFQVGDFRGAFKLVQKKPKIP